ncbi:MAG: phosphatidate cytidylyltransferase [Bacteroidia bacterium]|nr:phosphatidate cytidylyltransferase [Bacteroidia bacterium]
MNNLTQRIITGFTGVALVTAATLYHEVTFLILCAVIALMSVYEFYRLCEKDGIRPQKTSGLVIVLLFFTSPFLSIAFGISVNLLPAILLFPFFIFIRELYTHAVKPFHNIAYTLLGIFYLAVPLFLFYLVAFQGSDTESFHGEINLGYFIILWSSDTGAYFTGKYFGRKKLFERISPKKTWEGVYGSVLTAGTAAWIVSRFYTSLTPNDWFALAGIIVITGTLGDLVESLFKRSIQVKDSGSIFPGHGGFLDRFDGLFLSAPFVFVYLLLFH